MNAATSIPPCKGCGSTNLKAFSRATICVEYVDPTRAADGFLHFAYSYAGDAERENWRVECGDCGRRMRTNLAPVGDG